MGNQVALESGPGGVQGWDWENSHVNQSYIDNTGSNPSGESGTTISDIVESGTVLIAAGPADLNVAMKSIAGSGGAADQSTIRIIPIGLVETAQVSLSKPLSRIFEIGSKLSYIIPGRTVGGISLSRVFFDGPSILKAIYMGEVAADDASQNSKYTKWQSNPPVDSSQNALYSQTANIGSGNLAVNLASSFFDHPCGLCMFFKDQESDTVSQIYFEGCNVSTYNLGISAGMNVLTEAINMEFVRVRPVLTAGSTDFQQGITVGDINIVSPNSVNGGTSLSSSTSSIYNWNGTY